MAQTVEELQAELVIVSGQISYIYANMHMERLEIQTPHGKTVVWHADFAKTLDLLQKRKAWLQSEIARLLGLDAEGPVDFSRPSQSVPIVFTGS